MKRHFYRAMPMIVILLLFGCKEEKAPPGPLEPALTGTLWGKVYKNWKFRRPWYPIPLDSALVEIEGTSYSAFTDSLGIWRIPDVKSGVYTVKYSKPKYGHMKIYNIRYNGGDDLYTYDVSLTEGPGFNPLSLVATADNRRIHITGTIDDTLGLASAPVFFGKRPPSVAEPISIVSVVWVDVTDPSESPKVNTLNIIDFLHAGFARGDTVYAALYTCLCGGVDPSPGYYDSLAGQWIVSTGISETPARAWFVME